jgi:hypothetical protein
MRLLCTTGLVALLGMAPGAGTGFAQSVNDMVCTLNNIVDPGDAVDRYRADDRPQEERLACFRANLLFRSADAIMGVTVIDWTIASKVRRNQRDEVFKAIAATALSHQRDYPRWR